MLRRFWPAVILAREPCRIVSRLVEYVKNIPNEAQLVQTVQMVPLFVNTRCGDCLVVQLVALVYKQTLQVWLMRAMVRVCVHNL